MTKPKHYSRLSESGIIIPIMPFSHSCQYTASVDQAFPKRVRFQLTGRTEKGPAEMGYPDGGVDLTVQNAGYGHRISAFEFGSDSPESYYWTFFAANEPNRFTVSDGAGNPFRINFSKRDAREFEIECEFFLVFEEDYDYDPRGNDIFVDHLPSTGALLRDKFADGQPGK
ncbi:CUB domain-containing protein [Pseudomonas sp. IT-347P]|uniref:hypothetical protein n=1 Tax=Pseudomonas sp. IT-347P TaxID=3026458 RepID=UPI0039DFDDC6